MDRRLILVILLTCLIYTTIIISSILVSLILDIPLPEPEYIVMNELYNEVIILSTSLLIGLIIIPLSILIIIILILIHNLGEIE